MRTGFVNPFEGEFRHFAASTESGFTLLLFVDFSKTPEVPMRLTVSLAATVHDVIGYGLYYYFDAHRDEKVDPEWCSVAKWSMRICTLI